MEKERVSPSLRQVVLRLILYRFFLPLVILELLSIGALGYLEEQKLVENQKQITQSITNMVDYHIDQGGRILSTLAIAADCSNINSLSDFMNWSWEKCGYFDTLYYLDSNKKVNLIVPLDLRYTGIDMSSMVDISQSADKRSITISRAFISMRTGQPTVYLIKKTLNNGYIVGELNLGLIQSEIDKINKSSNLNCTFVMDQFGTLLAHPSKDLVSQKTNKGDLKIFKDNNGNVNNLIYKYDGKSVIGSANKSERTGWIVVDQVSILSFFHSYIWIIVTTLVALLICWIILIGDLKTRFKRYVINPLEKFSAWTNELAFGDFKGNKSLSLTTTFSELKKLETDFNHMSNILKARESSLKESEERYRGLFSRVPIGLFSISLNGEILDVNPSAVEIVRYPSREELLRVNISDLFSIFLQEKDKSLEEINWDFDNFETEIKAYDGTIIWVRVNCRIVHSEKENIQYCEGSIEDISHRKATEEKIREQQELLLEAEKTQREILEKSLVMKDEFISLISHEFKTPLNVIYSALQLIEGVYSNQISERVKELIGNVKINTFRQLKLANNLIDITELNSGHTKINLKNIDIVKATQMITEYVGKRISKKNITISFKSNIENKDISIDYDKYQRILLNLLSNSAKFTDYEGNISVILKFDNNDSMFEIKVVDTGIGIPKDKQELIFKQFGQADNNLSRQAEGIGIGLFLVRQLISLMGGTINLDDQSAVGSSFIIKLPLKEAVLESKMEDYLNIEDKLVRDIKIEFSDVYM